jgi:CRP-like cAMP-binding protein
MSAGPLDGLVFLDPEQRARLAKLVQRREYAVGDALLEEGEASKSLIFIEQGVVRVERAYFGARIPIAELHEGEVLGEISVLEQGAASATVVAVEPVTALVLDDPNAAVADDPELAAGFYRSLALLLAQRLRYSTDERRDFAAAFSWG